MVMFSIVRNKVQGSEGCQDDNCMEDFVHTAKFAGFFWGLSIISSFFSTAFIMLVAVNALFLHRIVYMMQQEKIDKVLATISANYEKYSKLIVDKIPKYVE